MRSSNKSRSRNKNQNRRSTQNVVNRVFDSSGPEGKVRGTPQQIIEKYQMLARDSQLSGDRVAAENFLQHSEHYARLLSEAQREQNQRREQQEAQVREQNANKPQQNEQPAAAADATPQEVAGMGDQPEAAVVEKSDFGLVETPEGQKRRNSRGRRPRKTETNETAEPATPASEVAKDSGGAEPDQVAE